MNNHSIRDLQEVEFSDTFDIQRLIAMLASRFKRKIFNQPASKPG
jgi:hypothetical protein